MIKQITFASICPPLPATAATPAITNFKERVTLEKALPSPAASSSVPVASSNFLPQKKSLSLKHKTRQPIPQLQAAVIELPESEISPTVNSEPLLLTEDPAGSPAACQNQAEEYEVFVKILEESLPPEFSHKILSVDALKVYHKDESCEQDKMFQAIVRVDIRQEEDVEKWLEEYQTLSNTDWRVRRTYPAQAHRYIFKKQYRCHNDTLAQYRKETKKAHYKHTQCKATVSFILKNVKMKRSKDEYLQTHPLEVVIDYCHNHSLRTADALRYRRPTPEVQEEFRKLFQLGHSPSSALHTWEYDLQIKHGDSFFEALADGSMCPSLQWCYHRYYSQFEKAYGAPDGPGMLKSLEDTVQNYNVECGSTCAAVKRIGETDLVVVLCSPLMQRVHKYLKSSAEINFLDSGGMMDKTNTRIFTLLAPSVAGALPLGIVMTSSESQVVLNEGMQLLLSILPPGSFYGRGNAGPLIAMTDDSTTERNVLKNNFPGIILLLCLFHVLQAYWAYVWDNDHKVKSEDREEIFVAFKQWCYSENKDIFQQLFKDQLQNPIIASNPILVKHLKVLHTRAAEWALCYREDLITRGNDTNNYSESTIRRYKDDILERLKAYSLVQLFHFFITRVEAYFERRIANVINNRKVNYTKSKHFINPKKLQDLSCSQAQQDNMYYVENCKTNGKYYVDMEVEVCTCPMGKNGAPCKHQQAVALQFNLSSTQFLPFQDEAAKLTLHKIMTNVAPSVGWYGSLREGSASQLYQHASDDEVQVQSRTAEMDLEQEDKSNDLPHIPDSDNADGLRKAAALESWNDLSEQVRSALSSRGDVYVPAIEKFSQHFKRLHGQSENALLSALHQFGQIDYTSRSRVRKGRYVKVNNKSVLRRKTDVGGRKCAPQGRPRGRDATAEHGYAAGKKAKKRSALPHNLQFRIEQTVGKKRKVEVNKQRKGK